MKLSKNFNKEEFTCNCGCGMDNPHCYLVSILQEVRDHFGTPVSIISGCRCEEHNKKIGGAEKSQHLLGKAADIKVRLIEPQKVYDYLDQKYPDTLGLGNGKTFTHVDVRIDKARWDYS